MEKKGEILTENLIFIILNLTFILILALFIFRQGGGATGLEEFYSKQIALIVDSAKPGMEIELDMSNGKNVDEDWFNSNFGRALIIENNLVKVKLHEDGRYSYSFFNDVDVGVEIGPEGNVFLVVRAYNG